MVVVTRVGTRFGTSKVPSSERVQWWARLASTVAAEALGQVKRRFTWVWKTHSSHLDMLSDLAPDGVRVVSQDKRTLHDIPGFEFLTVRLDADDAWLPAALDAMPDLEPGSGLSFPCGWQIDLETGKGYTLDYRGHWTPPYLAFATTRENMLDLGPPHPRAKTVYQLRDVCEPSWVQLVGSWNTHNAADRFGDGNAWPVASILNELGIEALDVRAKT